MPDVKDRRDEIASKAYEFLLGCGISARPEGTPGGPRELAGRIADDVIAMLDARPEGGSGAGGFDSGGFDSAPMD